MAAALDDPPVVDDEDLVGVAHGGQAVGDDDDGAPGRQAGQGGVDVALGGRVGLGGGLVQDQDRGVLEVGARQGDALALPAGEEPALLPQDGVVAAGQAAPSASPGPPTSSPAPERARKLLPLW